MPGLRRKRQHPQPSSSSCSSSMSSLVGAGSGVTAAAVLASATTATPPFSNTAMTTEDNVNTANTGIDDSTTPFSFGIDAASSIGNALTATMGRRRDDDHYSDPSASRCDVDGREAEAEIDNHSQLTSPSFSGGGGGGGGGGAVGGGGDGTASLRSAVSSTTGGGSTTNAYCNGHRRKRRKTLTDALQQIRLDPASSSSNSGDHGGHGHHGRDRLDDDVPEQILGTPATTRTILTNLNDGLLPSNRNDTTVRFQSGQNEAGDIRNNHRFWNGTGDDGDGGDGNDTDIAVDDDSSLRATIASGDEGGLATGEEEDDGSQLTTSSDEDDEGVHGDDDDDDVMIDSQRGRRGGRNRVGGEGGRIGKEKGMVVLENMEGVDSIAEEDEIVDDHDDSDSNPTSHLNDLERAQREAQRAIMLDLVMGKNNPTLINEATTTNTASIGPRKDPVDRKIEDLMRKSLLNVTKGAHPLQIAAVKSHDDDDDSTTLSSNWNDDMAIDHSIYHNNHATHNRPEYRQASTTSKMMDDDDDDDALLEEGDMNTGGSMLPPPPVRRQWSNNLPQSMELDSDFNCEDRTVSSDITATNDSSTGSNTTKNNNCRSASARLMKRMSSDIDME